MHPQKDIHSKVGFAVFGPLLLEWMSWIDQEVSRQGKSAGSFGNMQMLLFCEHQTVAEFQRLKPISPIMHRWWLDSASAARWKIVFQKHGCQRGRSSGFPSHQWNYGIDTGPQIKKLSIMALGRSDRDVRYHDGCTCRDILSCSPDGGAEEDASGGNGSFAVARTDQEHYPLNLIEQRRIQQALGREMICSNHEDTWIFGIITRYKGKGKCLPKISTTYI